MADAFAEGGIEVQIDFKTGPQALPTDGPNKFFDAGQPTGDSDAFLETDSDMEASERQDMPAGEAGGSWSNMDWNGVAPYKYPEYPGAANPPKTRFVQVVPD